MKLLKFMSIKKESEKALEARLVREVQKRGGIALKLTSQFHRGMPDRLILLPYHSIVFVELKSTGEKPRPLQDAAIAQLKSFRFTVKVIDSTEGIDELMASLDERLREQEEAAEELLRKKRELKKEITARRKQEKLTR